MCARSAKYTQVMSHRASRSGQGATYVHPSGELVAGSAAQRQQRRRSDEAKAEIIRKQSRDRWRLLTKEQRQQITRQKKDKKNERERQKKTAGAAAEQTDSTDDDADGDDAVFLAAGVDAAAGAAATGAAATSSDSDACSTCFSTCRLLSLEGPDHTSCHVQRVLKYFDQHVTCQNIRDDRFCSEACRCGNRLSRFAEPVEGVHELIEIHRVESGPLQGQHGVRVKGIIRKIPAGALFALFGGRRVDERTYTNMRKTPHGGVSDWVTDEDHKYTLESKGMYKMVLPRVNGVFVPESTIMSRANHSCNPTARMIDIRSAHGRMLYPMAQAIVDLEGYDEVTIDYGRNYAGGKCQCGSANCRQTIGKSVRK